MATPKDAPYKVQQKKFRDLNRRLNQPKYYFHNPTGYGK